MIYFIHSSETFRVHLANSPQATFVKGENTIIVDSAEPFSYNTIKLVSGARGSTRHAPSSNDTAAAPPAPLQMRKMFCSSDLTAATQASTLISYTANTAYKLASLPLFPRRTMIGPVVF